MSEGERRPTAREGAAVAGRAVIPVVLSGFGRVGRAYADRLAQASREGSGLRLAAVRTGSGEWLAPSGTDAPPPSPPFTGPPAGLAATLALTRAAVLVQALPSTPRARATATAEAVTALRSGVHVVTAAKAHLLSGWRELEEAAREGGALIRLSAATGAALPAGDLARSGVRGLGCRSVRACPNGTSTFVLDVMARGGTLAEALAEARRLGIAEGDPSADLSGRDAATKVVLLAALLWGWDAAAVRWRTEPIEESTAVAACAAAGRGRRLRAVASAAAGVPHEVRVRLEETPAGDPMHALAGPEKAVVYGCPEAGDITVSGGRSSPLGAALALFKDTLEVAERRRYGFG
ncbi:homoserine dehydrogenase [Streptomyces griseoviridis]|uniref:Homoserine dehydrogenase n=1 Tax=Streptomyces griseoviridis TaxID=45398 RepID=A0A3S9Z5M7_STRGD|nr:homoserine dehydrogenase [Streptomyces griseoviridis]AZS83074.1 homoserine dehydrogenase [Streptomyces griseoviridis]QCN90073.1 homoserine dehydrogenase [Streptomyces griseoviridis]